MVCSMIFGLSHELSGVKEVDEILQLTCSCILVRSGESENILDIESES